LQLAAGALDGDRWLPSGRARASTDFSYKQRWPEELRRKDMSVGKQKIIDFRNRPPLMPYKGLFDLKKNALMKTHMIIKNRGANTATRAMDMVDQPGGMEQWWKEIDEAGIDAVVVNGRYVGGMPDFCMDNDTLAGLQNKYKGRLFGLSQVNLDQDPDKTAPEVERGIKQLGMRGANLEPGYQMKGLGKMGTFTDDPSFCTTAR
jgi:predicted TIM-barrel fold metal-dependent hydrolase